MTENTENFEEAIIEDVHSEMLLVGSFYKNPSKYISWGKHIKSKYDFNDDATRFFYNLFENIYKTLSEDIDEIKITVFTTQPQNKEILKRYNEFGGYKTIESWMNIADANDFEKYHDSVKKYSLLREYENKIDPRRLLKHSKFPELKPKDIHRLMRSKIDRIHTNISSNEESVILNDGIANTAVSYLSAPQMGIEYPWSTLTEMFRGCRLGKVVLNGFLSNEGKSRNLMMLAAYITLIKGEKFLLLSNEMSEEDLKSCLITTVINNKEFKEFHGIDITKPEKEIVLGQYKDEDGKYIERQIDDNGFFIESEEDFYYRIKENSQEFNDVMKVLEWVEKESEGKIFFKDVGTDYSDQALEFEYRKHKILHGVKYMGYDTLKGYRTDDWQTMKQTATKLKELMKEIGCFMWAVFQLTDNSVYTNIFELSSNNIANAKHIKHVADYMLIGKKVGFEEYGEYEYEDEWGTQALDRNKRYFAMVVEKNRGGSKMYTPLFEYNLDLNVWNNVGSLIRKDL